MSKIHFSSWFIFLWLLAFNVFARTIDVTVVDDQSGSPMAATRVSIDKLGAGGKFNWLAGGDTDQNGHVSFQVNSGNTYRVRAKVYNHWIYADPITTAQSVTLRAGTLPVTVIRESTGQPLAGLEVSVSRKKPDGKWQWLEAAISDSHGKVLLSPPGLGQGQAYRLQAKSPVDGQWMYSASFTQPGARTFTLGNTPLTVHLQDAVTGAKLSGVTVKAYEVLADGSLQGGKRLTTDSNGQAVFDLPGLGKGHRYLLSAKPYEVSVKSAVISSPGPFTFKLGSVPVRVVNEGTGAALAGLRVDVSRRESDGKWHWVQGGVSNAQGIIHLDPPGLGQGQAYRLQAKSPVDGSWMMSENFTQAGARTFSLSNTPLTVQLKNALSGAKLSGVKITAYRVQFDGKLKYVKWLMTNNAGQAAFDLPGLGSGQSYILSAKPYGISVKTAPIINPGSFNFTVGSVPVKVVSEGTGNPVVGLKVSIGRLESDGKWHWVQDGTSDAQGKIHFDPPGLGQGQAYRLQAKSPVDGQWMYSASFTQPGARTFTLGNTPLTVHLQDAIKHTNLSNVAITVYQVQADGSLKWTKRLATDHSGQVAFDLPGLGKGTSYRLKAKPFGVTIVSADISTPGRFEFKAGALPVTLKNRDTGQSISGKELVLMEKMPDGHTFWKNRGVTDQNGVVHFDDLGLGTGKVYLIAAKNPFNQGKTFYSAPISNPGAMTFAISSTDPDGLDRHPPELTILSPAEHGKVAAAGFRIRGQASDRHGKVSQIKLTVTDPVTGGHAFSAQFDSSTGFWNAVIPGGIVTPNKLASVQAEAFDDHYNRQTQQIQVQVVDDRQPPQITILSPDGGDLTDMGFLMTGTVFDETHVFRISGTLSIPGNNALFNKDLSVSDNGHWAFAVPPGLLKAGDQATVIVEAEDDAGFIRRQQLTYPVIGAATGDRHLINRITFGATPQLLRDIRQLGRQNYLQQQLHPDTIDDSFVEAKVAQIALNNTDSLKQKFIYRMLFSKRQLNEVMTWFWDNHFNTSRGKTRLNWELAENQGFRAHALGKFRDLLAVSATSPAMLKYLDNADSHRGGINENYARELMELHTLGINGGYTHQDIVEVARALTGWRYDWHNTDSNQFVFDSNRHDYDEKIVLGHILPAGQGIEDGQQVLDILAGHPSTARFICTKLAQFFISDTPLSTTISACATVFMNTDGDIRQVVENLLTSAEFNADNRFHAKFKTPLEFILSSVRALQPAQVGTKDLFWEMGKTGMNLFYQSSPTGWGETADKWISSNQMMARFYFANHLSKRSPKSDDARITYLDLPTYFSSLGLETSEGIVGYLFQILCDGDYSEDEWNMAMDYLILNKPLGFSLQDADANRRLQQLTGFVLSLPETQLQ